MRVLWKCNTMLPAIAENLGLHYLPYGGWMNALYDMASVDENIELGVCVPGAAEIKGEIGDVRYYTFDGSSSMSGMKARFKEILADFMPDIVHIFGTEYNHTLALVDAFDNPEKTILQIQGLKSVYAKHFMLGVPLTVQYGVGIYELYFKDFLWRRKKHFIEDGKCEINAIKKTNNIIGRTDWDRACTAQINSDATYYFCNESLRDCFYFGAWDINKVERHSIFVSQCSYPIKGFHFLIAAMNELVKKYPDAVVYTTGEDILAKKTYKLSSYQRYLKKMILGLGLEKHFVFLGVLNEEEMKEQYLRCNVFVSPSTIENSSNSIGEAMLLGVPVVSSCVGGVLNLIEPGEQGFIYQTEAEYMLSYYMDHIFENDEVALKFSQNARKKAYQLHNRETNYLRLREIYISVMGKKGKNGN